MVFISVSYNSIRYLAQCRWCTKLVWPGIALSYRHHIISSNVPRFQFNVVICFFTLVSFCSVWSSSCKSSLNTHGKKLIQLSAILKSMRNVFVCKTGSFIMPSSIISPSQFTGRKKRSSLHDLILCWTSWSQLIETKIAQFHSMILQGIWHYQTYSHCSGAYSPGYFTNVVAPDYVRLSELIGKRVAKKNCRALLEFYVAAR